MLLRALDELYGRLAGDDRYEIAPPGFSSQKISFRVVLRPDGSVFGIDDARDHSGRKPAPTPMLVPGSAKPSGSGINPNVLWDQSRYLLGFKPDDDNPQRTSECFKAFRDTHLAIEADVGSAAFSTVCRFLERWDPTRAAGFEVLGEAARTGFGVFQMVGEVIDVHDDPRVKAWWRSQNSVDPKVPRAQCLVTGSHGPIARTHPKIKGVIGAQGAGAALVGFNDPAYESHGLSQSYNAPITEESAFRYSTALNALLDGPQKDRHRLYVGDTTMAFWTERATLDEDVFMRYLGEGSAAIDQEFQDSATLSRLKLFLEFLRQGRDSETIATDIEDGHVPFYLVGLSPNAGRVSQRFVHRGRLADLRRNLSRHFRDIGLDGSPPRGKWRGDPEFPSLRELLRQTARDPKEIPPLLEGALVKAIISGTGYPQALYSAVLRRARTNPRPKPPSHESPYLRCAILKGFLNRNLSRNLPMALDESRSTVPYVLGRLFAVLEKTQEDALGGGLNKTIRDTYYGSASATPGVVFPRLLRTYQHHLSKLEGGRKVNREKLLQTIVDRLEQLPGSLALPDQGEFAIGYYHQRQAFFQPSGANEANEQTPSD